MTAASALALDPRDELFLCAHYKCTLRRGVCLKRQAEKLSIRSTKQTRPAFEHCGSGDCAQGAALAAELGAAPGRMQIRPAVHFPGGRYYVVPTHAPAAPNPTSEVVPMAVARVPCSDCGSLTRHRNGCSKKTGAGPIAAKREETRAAAPFDQAAYDRQVEENVARQEAELKAARAGLPSVEDLPEPYLAACVREARRRLACAKVLEEALAS